MFILLGGFEMQIKEVKEQVQELLNARIGIEIYVVLKKECANMLKFMNISDVDTKKDNTSDDLLMGFKKVVEDKLSSYDENTDILKLSSADERMNALYFYDLEELPEEMSILYKAIDEKETSEIFNFKEDDLSEILAFVVVLGDAERKIVLYKQQYHISLLKKDKCMLMPMPHKNRLIKVEKDILRMDFNYQFFLWNGTVYVSDIEKMEKICSFHAIIVNEAKKSIKAIEDMEILDDVQVLRDELDNISFARKLTRIYSDSKVIGKVDNDTILEFTRRHSYFKKCEYSGQF